MARHVDPDDHSFRNSLLRAAAGGVAALVVTFVITAVLSQLGRDGGDNAADSPAIVLTDSPTAPQTQVTDPPSSATPTPQRTQRPEPTEEPTPVEATQVPAGSITIQVLYTAASQAQALEAAEVLRRLGYDVVAVNGTAREIDETTILFSPGHEADAEALRNNDDRFTTVQPNDGFNESVDLHVLVGPEF